MIPRELQITPIARKSTLIMGILRCGKTTWQYEKIQALLESNVPFENICFIDFSDDRLYFLRAEDSLPSIITDTYYGIYPHKHDEKVYFFFDEIQYVNLWGSFINRLQISENCEIYITGSPAKLLSKEISTEIATRTFSWELFPFSFVEFLRFKNISILFDDVKNRDEIKKGFDEYFYKGGMPERLILPNDTMVNKYF
ncbi:MAG: AAA family ATPase [Pleomorphochaeta sp.]